MGGRGRALPKQIRFAAPPRARGHRSVQRRDRNGRVVDLGYGASVRCDGGARFGQLDGTAGLGLELRLPFVLRVRGVVCRMFPVTRIALFRTIAVAHHDPAHRLADVHRDARQA